MISLWYRSVRKFLFLKANCFNLPVCSSENNDYAQKLSKVNKTRIDLSENPFAFFDTERRENIKIHTETS